MIRPPSFIPWLYLAVPKRVFHHIRISFISYQAHILLLSRCRGNYKIKINNKDFSQIKVLLRCNYLLFRSRYLVAIRIKRTIQKIGRVQWKIVFIMYHLIVTADLGKAQKVNTLGQWERHELVSPTVCCSLSFLMTNNISLLSLFLTCHFISFFSPKSHMVFSLLALFIYLFIFHRARNLTKAYCMLGMYFAAMLFHPLLIFCSLSWCSKH